MSKVVNISSRREMWNTAFESENISAAVSSHGRLRIIIGHEGVTMELSDASLFLGAIARRYDGVVETIH
jgi:hypothetical protein